MRTWSVRGTARALWIRSSSLSISSSTSNEPSSGDRAGTTQASRSQSLRDEGGNPVVDRAPPGRHLPHTARTHEAVLRRCRQVDGFDLRRQMPVELRHLEFVVEVRDRAQSFYHD